MIPFPTPQLHAVASPGGKTFADWVLHAAARASNEQTPLNNIPYGAGARLFRSTYSPAVLPLTGGYGSPWMYLYAGTFEVLLRHSMVSEAVAAEQKSNSGVVIYTINGIFEAEYLSPMTRNGVTTEGYDLPGNPGSFYRVTEASFWDFTLGKARTVNPYSGSGPVDYSNAGWTP